jgi:hypothetical protein
MLPGARTLPSRLPVPAQVNLAPNRALSAADIVNQEHVVRIKRVTAMVGLAFFLVVLLAAAVLMLLFGELLFIA